MGFSISPSVNIIETDLSNIVPAVATTGGATVGAFQWGPVLEPNIVSSEKALAELHGKPDNNTFIPFFTAANFLSYSNNMLVTRVIGTGGKNAVSSGTAVLIKNEADYEANYSAGEGNVGTWAAKYAGSLGNSLKVSMADSASFKQWEYQSLFSRTPGTSEFVANQNGADDEVFIVVVDAGGKFTGVAGTVLEKFEASKASDAKSYSGSALYYADVLNYRSAYVWWMDHPASGLSVGGSAWGTTSNGTTFKTIPELITVTVTDTDVAPGTSANIKVTKVGSNGEITGVTIVSGGTGYHSATTTATISGGGGTNATLTLTITGGVITTVAITTPGSGYSSSIENQLTSGADDYTVTDADIMNGYALYANSDIYDVSLIALGKVSPTVANYVISNVAEVRKDCVVFVSPHDTGTSDVIIGSNSQTIAKVVEYKNAINIDSSYGFIDSGYKYQYDRYNDKYRWIPLNGDIAGLCARTDAVTDPWFSPGGYNRGQIKNVVKLSVTTDQALRDELYKNNINPVVTFRGQGTILYGDKTMQTKPSAFDRINVRRLFIVLEKAIATAAKYQLFELNDAFTRAQFRAMVEPFLRDVKGRRGLYDFKVVCDETNNTAEVIDRNEFKADIYLKPARSINYIYLNFVATRTDANFTEIIGNQ